MVNKKKELPKSGSTKKNPGRPKQIELNHKQRLFCQEYVKDLNASAAYVRAGYATNRPDVTSARLLGDVRIKAYINELVEQRSKRTAIDSDYVLYGIQSVVERCRQGEPVLDQFGNPTGEWRFEPQACLTGYKMLGQHLKLFTEKHEVTGKDGKDIFGTEQLERMLKLQKGEE